MLSRRERNTLVATCAIAVAAPAAAASWLQNRITDRLAPALSRVTGQPVSIGTVEAGLTGDVRICDVTVGDLFSAAAIEGAVSLDSLLAGDLSVDEIRVIRPRIRAEVDDHGRSAWHEMLGRLARRRTRAGASPTHHRLRRIVVSGGALTVEIAGARLSARDVELQPQAEGVRLLIGPVSIVGSYGSYRYLADFARVGADVRLPGLTVDRIVAVGGHAQLHQGNDTLLASGVDVHRLGARRSIELTAQIDDAGTPRAIEVAFKRDLEGSAIAAHLEHIPIAILGPFVPGGVELARTHLTGTVAIATHSRVNMFLDAEVAVDGLLVHRRELAAEPVLLDGSIAIEGSRLGERLDLDRIRVTRGAVAVGGHAWLRLDAGNIVAGAGQLELPRTTCRSLIDALPYPLRGPLDDLSIRGDVSGTAGITIDLTRQSNAVTMRSTMSGGCQAIDDAPAADPHDLLGAFETLFPDGHHTLVGPGVRDWVDPFAVPSHVRGAFIAAEDARFWDHDGFDLAQIERSLEIDLREHRFARGGSTISQQLVKNSFLRQERTIARKLQEAILTWRLEAVLDKRDILARYLNVVELAPGIYGIAAGARYWFGKPAAKLSVREAAFLAAMTPAPRTLTQHLQLGRALDADMQARIDIVLRAMRRAGVIDSSTVQDAANQKLTLRFGVDGVSD